MSIVIYIYIINKNNNHNVNNNNYMGPKSIKTIENIFSETECTPKYGTLRGFATTQHQPVGNLMRLSSPDSSCMFAAVCRIDSRIPSDHDLLQRSWRICTKFQGIQKEQWPSNKGGWTRHLHSAFWCKWYSTPLGS